MGWGGGGVGGGRAEAFGKSSVPLKPGYAPGFVAFSDGSGFKSSCSLLLN